jgi:hypothetical protein
MALGVIQTRADYDGDNSYRIHAEIIIDLENFFSNFDEIATHNAIIHDLNFKIGYSKSETFDEYYARFITGIGLLTYISDAQKISLMKRNLDKRLTFKILGDIFKTFHKFVSMVRRVNITLTIMKKANPKKRGNRGNEKKGKEKTSTSFSVSAIILTISTNTDSNVSKSDKLYPKYV